MVILSVEDDVGTTRGALDSLELSGHQIISAEDAERAMVVLRTESIGLVILDQVLHDDKAGGVRILFALKNGELGSRNREVPFTFITGSRDWVDESTVRGLSGYMGIEVKGRGGESRHLQDVVEQLQPKSAKRPAIEPGAMRRIPLLIERVLDERVTAHVPAWDVRNSFEFPLVWIPAEMRADPQELTGSWMFARMNLYEPNPEKLVVMDFEPTELLEDDDGHR
jgi:CheY-like chemotaxis protein